MRVINLYVLQAAWVHKFYLRSSFLSHRSNNSAFHTNYFLRIFLIRAYYAN